MLPDPRLFSCAQCDFLIDLAQQSLTAEIPVQQGKFDDALHDALRCALAAGEGTRINDAIERAPSVDIARHIWRRLAEAFDAPRDEALVTRLFALPVALVAASNEPLGIDGVLPQVDELIATLQAHGALGGNRNFALGNALVAAGAVEPTRLPGLFAWQELPERGTLPRRALEPAPIQIAPSHESVHLRFLLGAAFTAGRIDLFAKSEITKWGIPLAQQIARQLAQPALTVLAIPRPPVSPAFALHTGRSMQREVGLQIYASNAIRDIRATVGEPSAVVSAHRVAEAPGGGEIRISLSSPFNPEEKRTAEGFRCPLYALDRVADVERLILGLLQDCRITDVQVLPQLFPDRDPNTGMRLFLRPETLVGAREFALQ